MTRVQVAGLLVSDEAGFACSKTKLVKSGLPHLRPFNIGNHGALDLTELYLVPASAAPAGKAELLAGDLLFNNTNSAELVGKSALVREPMMAGFSNHVTRIRVHKDRVDPEWLGFWLQRLRSTGFFTANATQWVSQAAYRASDLKKLWVDLPSLEDQRRVVDLLSRAQGIVRLRRDAQKKAAEIIPALFLDMFGHPATNPKAWDETTLGDAVEEFRYGTSQKSGEEGFPTLRIPNVIGDRLNPTDMKLVAVSGAEAERLRLRSGDLLFVRTNGNPDYVGRSAVYEHHVMQQAGFDSSNCLYASYLIRARLSGDRFNPRYLQSFLSSAEGRKRLRERARTSAGQYNINIEGLSSIRVHVPPRSLQSLFEKRCEDAFAVRALQEAGMEKADATFSALLAHTFSDRGHIGQSEDKEAVG